jgi:hypothetical protein
MATQLSKADQIRKLLHLSNAEIVRLTGFSYAYVHRVRQHTSPSGNPMQLPCDVARDRKYKVERYRNDPEFRERKKRIVRAYRERNRADPEFIERRRQSQRAYCERRAEARAS